MKFLNKKEQVFDIQLTPYGKQKLSMGKLKPVYYAFFDDNVLYDIEYAHSGASEQQNNIHKRIKEDTAYLETQTFFEQILSELWLLAAHLKTRLLFSTTIFTRERHSSAMLFYNHNNKMLHLLGKS